MPVSLTLNETAGWPTHFNHYHVSSIILLVRCNDRPTHLLVFLHIMLSLSSVVPCNHVSIGLHTCSLLINTLEYYTVCMQWSHIEILLCNCLSITVTNVADEQSFSKLKRIKNFNQNSVLWQKTDIRLVLMNVEHELIKRLGLSK